MKYFLVQVNIVLNEIFSCAGEHRSPMKYFLVQVNIVLLMKYFLVQVNIVLNEIFSCAGEHRSPMKYFLVQVNIVLPMKYFLVQVNIVLNEIFSCAGEHRSPEFLKLNPHGEVPVLVDGKVVVFEACAILLYLAEKYTKFNRFGETDQEKMMVSELFEGLRTIQSSLLVHSFWDLRCCYINTKLLITHFV